MSQVPIIILDNNLLDHRGHHLALATAISNAAIALGHPVSWHTHRHFDVTLAPKNVNIEPVFSSSMYELYARGLGHMDLSWEYANVLSALIRQRQGQRCLILIHSADAHVYRAVHQIRPELQGCQPIELHLCTPYEPSLMPGAKAADTNVGECLCGLGQAGVCDVTVFLWGETDRLAEYYRRFTRAPVVTLHLPAPTWASPDIALGRDGSPLKLAFLGAARDEKGFHKLPELVRAIRADAEVRDRITFDFQCAAPIIGHSRVAEDAIEQLKSFGRIVKLRDQPLSVEQYANAVNGCDAVLFPYKLSNYFARGSGIVIEAYSAGKYLVGQSGTFADDLEDFGLARLGPTPEDWLASIRQLALDTYTARTFASAAGNQFKTLHSATAYVRRLLFRRFLKPHVLNIRSMSTDLRLPLLVAPAANISRARRKEGRADR
jgi:hypothetical protein